MCNNGNGTLSDSRLKSDCLTIEQQALDIMDSPTMTPGSVLSSADENPRVKFLCSFGGSILPRPQDGKLRYVGGETRIVSVQHDISYEDLMEKMMEIFEGATILKYQQLDEDLDALVSVVNDDDVINMMEECDKLGSGDGFTRLRIFLFSHQDQDASLHFGDGDERDNERRYVDALNSLNESPEHRMLQQGEFLVGGPIDDLHLAEQYFNQMTLDNSPNNTRNNDVSMPQINLRHLRIPHMSLTQPQQSVNQRCTDMEAPWSPAYYSPMQTGHHDPRPLAEFPTSPSSLRYFSPYTESPENFFDLTPEEYNRLQGNQQSLYEHQPQYTDNVQLFPTGLVPSEKTGYPVNILHGANVVEGNSICEHCQVTFQRRRPHPDSPWKPAEQSHFDMGNGHHQVAHACAECPPNRERVLMNADASLHHSYYPREQNDRRCLYSEAHSHERGCILQHQPHARAEENIHASRAGRLNDHYVLDNGANISLGHSNFTDGQQVQSHYLHQEEPRQIRTVQAFGNQVLCDQMVATGHQINVPSMEDRGARYGNPPYTYGADTLYQVPHANIPAHSLRKNIHGTIYGGPSYEAASSTQLESGSTCPGYVGGILENSPRLRAGTEKNPWIDSSQKKMVFDGSSMADFSHGQAQNLMSNAHSHDNQSMHTGQPIQSSSDMLTVAAFEDPFLLKADTNPLNDDRLVSLNKSLTKLTTDLGVNEEDSSVLREGEQKNPSGEGEGFNMCNGILAEAKPETIQHNPASPDKKLPKDRLNFLPDVIASVKEVVFESVNEVKAEGQENVDSFHQHDAAAEVGNENESELAENHVGSEMDFENENPNNSKIEPTKAEAEAVERGLQTIKDADLEEIRELGSGTYGSVFHGKWKGSDVAIKRIKASCFAGRPTERERLIADFWKEALILSSLHHPNVISFYGVVRDGPDGSLATVTEFMINGSLKQFIQKKDRTIDRRKRLIIAMDAAFGMEYLHGKNIVHFDLKCENLLVNMRDPHRPMCKIGDLGLSKVKQHTLVSGGVRGTLPWMAPELLSGKSNMVTEKIDVYSFGIVMWELLTGDEPYANMHCASVIGGIVNNTLRPEIPTWCDPEWKLLMESCWASDPAQRPSFSEISQRLRSMAAAINVK